MPDQDPLMQSAYLVYLSQPLEERLAVHNQRRKALRHLQRLSEQSATEDDLETMDTYIGWWREKIDAHDNQLERRRQKTRERVARWRPRKPAPKPQAPRQQKSERDMAAKTWRRKDGSLLRPPEPETYMISITRDQSQAARPLPKPKPKASRRTNSLSALSSNSSEADHSPTP